MLSLVVQPSCVSDLFSTIKAVFAMADPLEEIITAMKHLQTGEVRVLQQARR